MNPYSAHADGQRNLVRLINFAGNMFNKCQRNYENAVYDCDPVSMGMAIPPDEIPAYKACVDRARAALDNCMAEPERIKQAKKDKKIAKQTAKKIAALEKKREKAEDKEIKKAKRCLNKCPEDASLS